MTANDARRRRRVSQLIAEGQLHTWQDFHNAALIFQHGLTAPDYKLAQRLATKAVRLGGGEWSRWLYAVATDRLLLAQNRKQKFGTQVRIVRERNAKTGRMRQVYRAEPFDRRTSDRTREAYGVGPLATLRAMEGTPKVRPPRKIPTQPGRSNSLDSFGSGISN